MIELLQRLREVSGGETRYYRNPDGPEAATLIEQLSKRVMTLERECYKTRNDLHSQCRINGAGASREARLMAEVSELKRKIVQLERELENVRSGPV